MDDGSLIGGAMQDGSDKGLWCGAGWGEGGGEPWVFAYGSLMWDPRFPVAESRPARLNGYHRALCILSIANRGTVERPGLVVGLDRGGSCVGRALKVAAADRAETVLYLRQREMSTNAYRPCLVPVLIDPVPRGAVYPEPGRRLTALTFVARSGHPQHVRGLSPEQQAQLIRQGVGPYGSSLDYLRNVCTQLDAFGIAGGPLHRVLALVERGGPDAPAVAH